MGRPEHRAHARDRAESPGARKGTGAVGQWKDDIKAKTFVRAHKMGRQYVQEKRLGAGAFGEGWLCNDTKNSRKVVVKVAHAPLAGARAEYSAKKEVVLMEAMDHPNVVKFYEAWVETATDRLHIAMEYCDAGDLGALLKAKQGTPENQKRLEAIGKYTRHGVEAVLKGHTVEGLLADKQLFGKIHQRVTRVAEKAYEKVVGAAGRLGGLSLAEVESWMIQLLWGVWYLHKKRVVHRDLKPDNIFLSGGGKIIKIGDFGVSGLQAHTNADLKTHAGTPVYMAPEMWETSGTYNDRVDVYALGCIMYEVCAMCRPFAARLPFASNWGHPWGKSNMQFLKHQMTISGVRPCDIPWEQCENSLFEVVKTMLRKDPRVRPTAGQVLRSIRMQSVARRVIDVFAEGDDPLLNVTDARHRNVHNPANNIEALHDTARFQASHSDSEILVMLSRHRVALRKGPSTDTEGIGYISKGDIIEVSEKVTNPGEACQWLRTQSGWCPLLHGGTVAFGPCPENLVQRDGAGVRALGAYTPVLDQVEDLLQHALRGKVQQVRGEGKDEGGSRESRGEGGTGSGSPRPSPSTGSARKLPFHIDPSQETRSAAPPRAVSPRGRPAAASPPKAPTAVKVPHQAPPPKGGSGGRGSGAALSTAPSSAAAQSPRKSDEVQKEIKKYRDLLLAALGDKAKPTVTEYFRVYVDLIKQKKMRSGHCDELAAYEATLLTDALNGDVKVLEYIRRSAELNYPC